MSEPMEFTSRRRRRCHHGALCPSGGVIHPGELAIRVAQHRYVHAVDGRVIVDVLRSFSAQVDPFVTAMKEFGRSLARAFEPFVAALVQLDVIQSDERPLVLPSGFEVAELPHYPRPVLRTSLADVEPVTVTIEPNTTNGCRLVGGEPIAAPHWVAPHWARGADPDATRVAALADEEIAAWQEILDGARSDG